MRDRKKLITLVIAIVVAISSIFIYKGAIAPKLYDKYLNTGIKYLMDGQYEEAILAFDKAIKIEPKTTEARVYQAKAYVGNEEFDEAVEVLEEAQKIDITNEELLKEILEILNQVSPESVKEFLDRFIQEIGIDNISNDIKEILNTENESPKIYSMNPEPGTYINPISISLKLEKIKIGHVYYYTTDGSEPTKESNKYVGKINIDENTTIKLIGYNSNGNMTDVETFHYKIDESIRKEIEASISTAENLVNTTQEGDKVGNCIEGSKEKLTKSINSAKKLFNKKVITYDNGIEIKESIDKAIDDFKYNIIEKTDKKELKDSISSVQKLYDNAIEGSKEGQYEPGSKSYLDKVIKDAKKLNDSILAKQDEIDDMVKKIENAKKEFNTKKVKAMPSDLGEKYLRRIRYEEAKANAIYEDPDSCMADIRGASIAEGEAYQAILKDIYVDLNKYLPSSKKQEIAANKIQFENEKNKILREQEIEIQQLKAIGAYVEIANIEFSRYSEFGELAKEYALNLINKYMK